MPKKVYFNWKLAVVLIIGLLALAITAYTLRQWQRSRRAETGLTLGNKAFEEGNWQQTAKYLGQYISLVRDDVPALLKYAKAQLNIRPLRPTNVQQAIGSYREALRVDKSNLDTAVDLAQIYLELRMPGEAELIINRTIEASPNIAAEEKTPQLYRLLAAAMAEQRKFDESIKILKQNIEKYPNYIPSYDLLGHLARQQPEKFTQPVGYWYDMAIEKNENSANAYIIRAAFYIREGKIQQASADLETAESKDLSAPATRLQLAVQLIEINALERSEKHLQKIYQQTPDDITLWKIRAELALRSESETQMNYIADTAMKELASQRWDFLPFAAELYIDSGQYEKAQNCIAELKQQDISPFKSAFLEGLLAYHKTDYHQAVSCWQQALQIQNDSPPQIRIRLARALAQTGDIQSALMQLRSVVSEQPGLLQARLLLAEMLLEAGKSSEAANQARTAAQLAPQSAAAALIYIQAQIQLLINNQVTSSSPEWENIKNNLANLEKALKDPLPARLLQFNVEMYQLNYENAQLLLNQMKAASPDNPRLYLAEAQYLTAQNKNSRAIEVLQKAVDKFPQQIALTDRLAEIYASENKTGQCEELIKNSLSIADNPIAKRELALLLTKYYQQWQQPDKKCTLLNQLTQQLPDDIPLLRALLSCEQLQDNNDRRRQLVDRIKSIEGEDGRQWQYEQAKLWFTQPDFETYYARIVSHLKQNLSANPDDQASRMLLASTYEKQGELALAVSTYREALGRSPDNINIIIPTVTALYKAKQYDTADRILQQATEQKLISPELTKLQLQAHISRGRLNYATEILDEMLKQDPNNYPMSLTLALLRIRQNNFSDAEKLLEKLTSAQPDSVPVKAAQIELYSRQGNTKKALDICDKLVNDEKNASAYILRARTLASLGKIQNAEQDLNLAIEAEPNNVNPWMARCSFYISNGKLDKALYDVQKAMPLQPENLQIQKTAIEIMLASNNPEKIRQAKELLEKALTDNPDDYDLRIMKARFLLGNQTAAAINQATSILEKIVDEQPHKVESWLLLGELTLKRDSIKAMDIALRALAHRPDDKRLLLFKARCEAATSPALAIPTLKALCELDPNDINPVLELANMQLAAENYQEAINILEDKTKQCKDERQKQSLKTTLVSAIYKNGNKKQAISDAESLLQSSPNEPEPLYVLAGLLCEDENYNQMMQLSSNWTNSHTKDTKTPVAIANLLANSGKSQAFQTAENILQTVLSNHPNCTDALSTQAMIMQLTERPDIAAVLYEKLLTIEPQNKIAINNMAWILCEHLQQYQKALELAQSGIKEEPEYININYINLIDTRGVIYYRLGQFDNAIKDFNKCIDLYPPDSPEISAAYLHLAKALEKTGQNKTALNNLQEALRKNDEIGGLSPKDIDEAHQLKELLSQGV